MIFGIFNILKMLVFPKLVYRLDVISIKTVKVGCVWQFVDFTVRNVAFQQQLCIIDSQYREMKSTLYSIYT